MIIFFWLCITASMLLMSVVSYRATRREVGRMSIPRRVKWRLIIKACGGFTIAFIGSLIILIHYVTEAL